MDKQNLNGFKPAQFIKLLLKLAGRANGQQVEVEVYKKGDKEVRTA